MQILFENHLPIQATFCTIPAVTFEQISTLDSEFFKTTLWDACFVNFTYYDYKIINHLVDTKINQITLTNNDKFWELINCKLKMLDFDPQTKEVHSQICFESVITKT